MKSLVMKLNTVEYRKVMPFVRAFLLGILVAAITSAITFNIFSKKISEAQESQNTRNEAAFVAYAYTRWLSGYKEGAVTKEYTLKNLQAVANSIEGSSISKKMSDFVNEGISLVNEERVSDIDSNIEKFTQSYKELYNSNK